MNYSLSYHDGLETGARRERERILSLLDKHTYGTDSQDTGVVYNYTKLIELIEEGENS
jgi:hypothetical protein